jgi:capsular exopolysaccharide synthesis family protein
MMNGNNNGNTPEQPRGPGLTDQFEDLSESLVTILWHRRWTVLAAAAVALAAGFVYLQRATSLYTSTSRVYVEQAGPQVFEKNDSGLAGRWTNYLYTQAEVLTSTSILSDAVKKMNVSQMRTLGGAANQIGALRRGLQIEVGKKDEIINISFKSPYPEEAAQIVNSVVDAYITSHEQRNKDTSGEVVKILREEKTKRDGELMQKLQKMMEFKQQNEGLAFGTDQDNNVIVRRLERLSTALTEAQLSAIESQSFRQVMGKMADDPVGLRELVEAQRSRGVYVKTEGDSDRLKTELKQLERTRVDSLWELKAEHPGIAALDKEAEQIKGQIADQDKEFARSQLAVAEQQYQASKQREEELQKYFEQQRQEAVSLNNQLAQYTILQSDYEQTKKLCDLLDDRIGKLNVASEVGSLNVTILETAQPARSPSDPQKARTMGLALCLGLFAGVSLALLREWRDQRLRSTREISALLGLPILGAVPSMGGTRQDVSLRGRRVQLASESREAEAYRTIRTAVFFGAPREEAKTILVTSPAPDEGKSTTVSNLAIAMAQTGQRVLVIDADFRRPMQHRIFELDRHVRGLSAVLAGQLTLAKAIEHTAVENLDVLTTGPDVSNPAEMLSSETFVRMIKTLAKGKKYDRVLVDSPPIAAVTDSQILAATCDVTLLVLRADMSTRRISLQAVESLLSVEARILGVVVNDVSHRTGRYGYHGGHGYHYCGYDRDGRKRHKRSSDKEEMTPLLPSDSPDLPTCEPVEKLLDEPANRNLL